MNYIDKERIKVFILGGGINSAVGRAHLSALSLCHFVDISGACFSRDNEINLKSAQQFGIDQKKIFNSSDELINSVNPGDGVFIVLTDTPSHAAISKLLIEKGHHHITEKAHAVSLEDGLEIEKLLLESRVFYRCIFNYLGFNVLRVMKRLIKEGLIGKVLRCDGSMPQDSFLRLADDGKFDKPQEWRQKDQVTSTVSLDLGVHVVSAMRYIADIKFQEISSVSGPKSRVPNVDSGYTAIYQDSESDIIGLVDYGKYNFGNRNGLSLRVTGNNGALEWELQSPDQLLYTDVNGTSRVLDKYSGYLFNAKELQEERFKVGHPTGFVEALSNLYLMFFEDLTGSKENTLFSGITEANEVLRIIGLIEGVKINVN